MFNNEPEEPTKRSQKILASKTTERILLVLIVLTFLFSLFLSSAIREQRQDQIQDTVADEVEEAEIVETVDNQELTDADKALENYERREITVDGQPYNVVIAETIFERVQGLSDTTTLPAGIDGMLFVFSEPGFHSIWMKDMNYSLDIYWLDSEFNIVHQELAVSPDTYPELSFASSVPVSYVLEIPTI